MKRIIIVSYFMLCAQAIIAMENSESNPVINALMQTGQRDLWPIIKQYLNIMDNPEPSPLRALFQKKHDYFKDLPEEHRIPCDDQIVLDIKISPDNTTAVIACEQELQWYDLATKTFIQKKRIPIKKYRSYPNFAMVSNNTKKIIFGHSYYNRPFAIFNTENQKKIKNFKVDFSAARISPNNSVIAAFNYSDDEIKLLDINLKKIGTLHITVSPEFEKKTQGGITILSFSPDGKKIAIIYGCNGILIFDVEKKEQIHEAIIREDLGKRSFNSGYEIYMMSFLPDNQTLVFSDNYLNLVTYNPLTKECANLTKGYHEYRMCRIYTLTYNKQTYILANQSENPGHLYIHSFTDNVPLKNVTKKFVQPGRVTFNYNDFTHPYNRSAIAVSPDHKRILVCSPDNTIICFDSRGFFNTIINRLAKLSFGQQLLLQAYDKHLAKKETPVKIAKDSLEEKMVKWMDPLVLEILLQEKIIELVH